MDTARAGTGTLIAGASGVLLFIFMFLPWFGAPGVSNEVVEQAQQAAEALGVEGPEDVDANFNAWESFEFIDLVLLLTVIVSVGVAAITLSGASVSLPVAGSAVTAGIGALAVVLVLYRIIDPPGDADREIGVFLGLLAAAGIAFGGYMGMQEEGTTFAGERDRLTR